RHPALRRAGEDGGRARRRADVRRGKRQRPRFLPAARLRRAAPQHGGARRRMARQYHHGEAACRRERPVTPERLYLFDTTLRDGAQTNGVDFTLDDKLAIAAMLATLGIDYVEGGYPGANPTDTELFSMPRNLAATFTAFGMTRRPGRSTANDPGLAALLQARADAICFVAKSWDYHVRVALETSEEENLASIRDS